MKRFLGALLSLMIMLACLGVQAEEDVYKRQAREWCPACCRESAG